VRFGHPSEKLIVIGVTGTNGKTTTVNLIARILEEEGLKVGYTSTATLNVDGKEYLNSAKMTMPSGWLLHKWMARMVRNKCECAIIEVSSEGLSQNRHAGIHFDIAVFTNLTPEHIEAHGGFENYKKAKGLLFTALNGPAKYLRGNKIPKTIVTNADSEHSEFYKSFKAENYVSYGVKNDANFKTPGFKNSLRGLEFEIENTHIHLQLKGRFDVYNALCAIATASVLGVTPATCRTALEKVAVVPGRMEIIAEKPFMVLVDYAYEPEEMRQLYETVTAWPHRRIIQVLGPTGGGRDHSRISVLGKMAAENAEIVIVTTDDPYDENPQELAQRMAGGATSSGKSMNRDLFIMLDRRAAMHKAFSLAAEGDLVLVTGKGADQKMALAHGTYADWDDRKVARQELGFLQMQTKKSETNHSV